MAKSSAHGIAISDDSHAPLRRDMRLTSVLV